MIELKLRCPLLLLSAFLIGVLSTLIVIDNFITTQSPVNTQTYTSYVINSEDENIMEIPSENNEEEKESQLMKLLGLSNEERASPYDWIKEDQIHVNKKNIIIDLENAEWAEFTDTNSMDPVIDENSHGIEIIPSSPSDIHVGDIVSYESSYTKGTIIHRVIKTGFDEKGWYAVFKGDNNSRQDPEKVRFSKIKRVLVAIIY